MLQPKASIDILGLLATPHFSASLRSNIRGLLLAAHPDDETIGASAALRRSKYWQVAYLTDGAPVELGLRSRSFNGSRGEYAAIRAEEAKCALKLAGIPAEHFRFMSAVDQESVYSIPKLVDEMLAIVREWHPEIVLTHPYEGGHPDHDTAALVARVSIQRMKQETGSAPFLVEMSSYHCNREGRRVVGDFLPTAPVLEGAITRSQTITVELTDDDRVRKSHMMACYKSQTPVLADFPLEPERLRIAPFYDFSQPPHFGQLWYEHLGWKMTGRDWRKYAAAVLEPKGSQCH
jgi:LmbE family N-acetylglucosaminyl deacetylase